MQHTSPTSAFANDYIDQHDAGLMGIQGAHAIVKLLRRQTPVHHLILGHNQLGDIGCIALFDYLGTKAGKKHQPEEISLNKNNIGDAGLLAIARYLEHNKSLESLFLQNNNLKGDRSIMLRFAQAITRSNLRTLSLTSNPHLGDAIPTTFLPNLSSPKLAELHLSVCSLGPSATPALLSYLTHPRSTGLHTLKLNGNPLGLPSATRIIHALERANWSVRCVEMYACLLNGASEKGYGWKQCEERLITVLDRNRFLTTKAGEEALMLFSHARPALLAFGRQASSARSRLPPELVIHILSFLAPTLSAAQHIRVCAYAASPSTLPSLRRPIASWWPSARHMLLLSNSGTADPDPSAFSETTYPFQPDDSKSRRTTWLQKVGCDRFEHDAGVQTELGLNQDVGGGCDNSQRTAKGLT